MTAKTKKKLLPKTRFTQNEKEFIKELRKQHSHAERLERLKEDLQAAVLVELATIPIYLYTYYSLQRTEHKGENITKADLFANEAGGVIMSVAVEEMLHLSLSCNILYSLGVQPELYGKSPGPYPTPLPYHNPKGPPGPKGEGDMAVLLPLSKFSYEQLWHFLQIEYPEPKDQNDKEWTWPKDRNWNTIGQFYSYIRCLIATMQDKDFTAGKKNHQIQPYNYSPNSIDTAHPRGKFDPWAPAPGSHQSPNGGSPPFDSGAAAAEFSDAADSYVARREGVRSTPLMTIGSKDDALRAIDTICDQGEGYAHSRVDDRTGHEESHYFKFLTIQAQLEDYAHYHEELPKDPEPPGRDEYAKVSAEELAKVVADVPDNPTGRSYYERYLANPALNTNYQPLADLASGIYQYMLIMTESIFKVRTSGSSGSKGTVFENQKLYFNQSMHNSMIWILDKLCQAMRNMTFEDGTAVAATFENIGLGDRTEAHANLMRLFEATKGQPYFSSIEYFGPLLESLPDVKPLWETKQVPGISQEGRPIPAPYPYQDAPAFPGSKMVGPQPDGMPLHACMGLNSCRGSDRYGTVGHLDENTGEYVVNDCAGSGYCSTAVDHTCHVANDCRNQGGCGLYGTADELNHPGVNDCKSLGSSATPINAERFSTNGPNQGLSVWKRARKVFEDNWEEHRKTLPSNAPARRRKALAEKPMDPPELFADTGPTYLWISNNNQERANMTACGASGLSGAGGCV